MSFTLNGEAVPTAFSSYPSSYIRSKAPRCAIPEYPREIVFLVGAPGAGKGTHSTHISKQRGFSAPTIVVSDLLNTPTCKLLKDHGIMIDDHFVFNTLLEELRKPLYRNGVVVDGFPRTAAQVELMTKFHYEQCGLSSQYSAPNIGLVMLHVDEPLSIDRQLERGRKLKMKNQQQEATGQPLFELRQTDLEHSAAKARYQVFEAQNEAIQALSQIFTLVTVDASTNIPEVRTSLSRKLMYLS